MNQLDGQIEKDREKSWREFRYEREGESEKRHRKRVTEKSEMRRQR